MKAFIALCVLMIGAVATEESTEIFCDSPTAPTNGYYTWQRRGFSVTYSCNHGYRLVGGDENYCLVPVRRWTFEPPVCQALECPPLAPVEDGSFFPKERTVVGTRVRFRCHDGTRLEGESYLTCRGSRWSGPPPTCVLPQCKLPPVESPLSYSGEPYLGSRIYFSCGNNDYQLHGPSHADCEEGERWLPSLEKNMPYCAPENGEYHDPHCDARVPSDSDVTATFRRKDRCYQFVNTEKTWNSAQEKCEDNGGTLVTIESEEMNQWLLERMNSFSNWDNNGVNIGLRWIDGQWKWANTAGGYDNPVYQQDVTATFYDGDCVNMRLSDGSWEYHWCIGGWRYKYKYICQYDM